MWWGLNTPPRFQADHVSRLSDAVVPLGLRVNALDLLFLPRSCRLIANCRRGFPAPWCTGAGFWATAIVAVTSFTPDEFDRERYLIAPPRSRRFGNRWRRLSIPSSPSKIITT